MASEPRRVLLVTSSFPRWEGDSAGPFVLNIAEGLAALGWDVTVLAPHAPGAKTFECFGEVKVRRFRYMWPESQQVLCYGGGALANLRSHGTNYLRALSLVFFEWLAVLRELRLGEYDVVQSHWLLPQGLCVGLACLFAKVPHVTTVHGSDVFALRGRLTKWLKRLVIRRAEVVSVNSSATKAAVLELDPRTRLVTIPMGVVEHDVHELRLAAQQLRSRFRRPGGPLLIFVGRLVEQKGAADAIRALALLSGKSSDATLVVVGEGPERPHLQQLAIDLNVEERVTFTGSVSPRQVAEYIVAGDVFVGPSRQGPDGAVEAQGLVFLEAMQVGTPVVATAVGGILDAVQHEVTGLLVAPESPNELAAAVSRLHSDPELASRLSAQGAELVSRRFTRKACAQAFSAEFRRLLQLTSL
jgi:phosphatidylinositol alpha-1,6-mannosyltransferase